MVTAGKVWRWSTIGLIVLGLTVLLALGVGAVSLGWDRVLGGIVAATVGVGPPLEPMEKAILFQIRLPRVLLTVLVGSALATSGAVLQALLRNPLAEPFVLGLSSGAAVGALLAIALGFAALPMITPLSAFLGALFTVLLVFAIAGGRGRIHTTTVLLTGVIVNAFFTSIIMLILTTSTEQKMHHMLFWLYGDLTAAKMSEVLLIFPLVCLALVVIVAHARGLNLLITGEETALQLGIPVERYKWVLFVVTSLLTGSVVAVSGIIGFVGLIVPHLVRMTVGPDHRLLLPLAAIWGGTFLVLADAVARLVMAPHELPVGVVTAALGAPFFILLLRQRGAHWNLS
jgi:iron complex transport system permease protein